MRPLTLAGRDRIDLLRCRTIVWMTNRFPVFLAAALLLGACSGSGTDTDAADGNGVVSETTSAPADTTIDSQTEPDAPEVDAKADEPAEPAVPEPVDGAVEVQADWEELEERWFVWGVASDDTLNVRAEPGVDGEVLTTLVHNDGEVVRYSEVVFVGETRWTPVAIGGGAGWVALDFLRPLPSVVAPEISGEQTISIATLEAVIEALDSPAALAAYVGDDGLTLSPQQFIDDATQTVTGADLTGNVDDVRVWGSEPGSGDTIESSVADFLVAVAGGTSFTSTEAIGFDTVISSGSIINSIEAVFPNSIRVEYLHNGTAWFGGLDWQSTTLVFNAEEELVAIAQGAWSP